MYFKKHLIYKREKRSCKTMLKKLKPTEKMGENDEIRQELQVMNKWNLLLNKRNN
uniref:Uncharacterized protein n=1 Tax=Amphimedon queenslandica TaxID=400682 RepID=A0A1X7TN84_AMPQE